MQIGRKGLYLIQCLVFSYVITGILLCILTFIVYQSDLDMKIANIGIVITYVLSSVFAGVMIGNKIGKRKFLWGFFIGMLYFLILMTVSWLLGNHSAIFTVQKLAVFILCIAGGTLGGMLAI